LNLWLASIFLSNRWVSIHNLGIKSPSRFAWVQPCSIVELLSNKLVCWTTLDPEESLFGSIRRPS
jgi:hypothetical protein